MERAYPILRIDDYEEAKSYYIEFLGFKIDFEWRHAEDFPVYMGVSRGGLALHLFGASRRTGWSAWGSPASSRRMSLISMKS